MNKLQLTLAALAAAGTLSLTTMAPASADSAASTRNIILGAAAIAGIAIESNVARKNAQANSISGYLPDGSSVYGDGHVVARNGYSYYPGNNGQTVSCSGQSCSVAYNSNQYSSQYNGNAANGARFNVDPRNGVPNRRYDANFGRGSDRDRGNP
jgi:hypothetical protein